MYNIIEIVTLYYILPLIISIIQLRLTDKYIRKMRMTGLLSLRGNGRFLDINEFEKDTASYVANNYSKYKKYEDDLYILVLKINKELSGLLKEKSCFK